MHLWSGAFVLAAFILVATAFAASAGSLQVAPVLLEVRAPAGATAIVVKNQSNANASAQVRVFRWQQSSGAEELKETRDVIASPPLFNVGPQSEQIVRLVRLSRTPVEEEKSFRVVIDEIPSATASPGQSVRFAMRYSIPLFFQPVDLMPAKLDWRVFRSSKKLRVVVRNSGELHSRISALKLDDGKGGRITLGPGLVGYVLPRAEMSWTFNSALFPQFSRGRIDVLATTERGPLRTPIDIQDVR